MRTCSLITRGTAGSRSIRASLSFRSATACRAFDSSRSAAALIPGTVEVATAHHYTTEAVADLSALAEPSTIYQLPEGRHGIYVGGGAKERPGNFDVPTKAGTILVTLKRK